VKTLLERALLWGGTWIFRAAERSPMVRDRLLRPAVMAFVESAIAAWRRGGMEAWRRWHLPVARAAGRSRAATLRRKLGIDPTSARSLGSVHDYEDPLLGIRGHWTEEGRARAVRVETECPIGERLRAADCPEFCRVIVHAFEEATLREMNPRYALEPLEELLSAGDARCTFVHRVPGG
jgi:hypothetical protein